MRAGIPGHRLVSMLLSVALLMLSGIAGAGNAAAAVNDVVQLTNAPPWWSPSPAQTDGTIIVWDNRQPVAEGDYTTDLRDIYAAQVDDPRPFPIATGDADQRSPAVSGDFVVWLEDDVIRATNLTTGEVFDVGTTGNPLPADVSGYERSTRLSWRAPAISGTWVVWLQVSGDTSRILARDLRSMKSPVTVVEGGITTDNAGVAWPTVSRPQISGERVLWTDHAGESATSWDLMSGSIDGSAPTIVTTLPNAQFDFAGDLVTFGTRLPEPDYRDATGIYHLDTGQKTVIASAPNAGPMKSAPATDGRYVFWGDETGLGGTWMAFRLTGFDTVSGSHFTTTTGGLNVDLDVAGGYVAVTQGHIGNYSVQAIPITDLLPSASQSDPASISPDWNYYPESSHYLSFGFKDFWTQNGGLPVFGFPLTEEFTQNGLTVQYLERQRFEYHPEFAGSPYEVELGRLGTEVAEERGLTTSQSFQPLPAGTTSNSDCTFFAQTGHRLCRDFKAYWQSHGLEFGDPGVSYRESLALFGYPISEEFTDPATGYTVQYFERARFEYHPDNPEPYRVLLGRLGADELGQQFK